MNYGGDILDHMEALLLLLRPHCVEVGTFDQLITLVRQRHNWHKAHHLFQMIRKKTIEVEKKHQSKNLSQYLFEEICAKTLFNLSNSARPFDADSAYWIIPNALSFAKHAGIPVQDVLSCVSKRPGEE